MENVTQKKTGTKTTLLSLLSFARSLTAVSLSFSHSLSLILFLSSTSSSKPLIHEVPRDEQREERRQRPINQPGLLPASHAVCPQTVALVLGKPGNLPGPGPEGGLSRAADGAAPVGGEVLEEGARRDGVLRVLDDGKEKKEKKLGERFR